MLESNSNIKVYEDKNQFLVKIQQNQKDRAKRIPSRRWDSNLVAWVYPKTISCYEALKVEFERDADLFDIRKPKKVSIPTPQNTSSTEAEEGVYEDDWKDLTRKTTDIHGEFTNVSNKMDSLLENFRILEESTNSIERSLNEQQGERKELKKNLNISTYSDQKLIEKALLIIAFEASGKDKSFANFVKNHNPLTKAEKFVLRTHEHLLYELAAIAGDSKPTESKFAYYIKVIKENNLVSQERSHNVPSVLHILNHHRNNITHAKEMNESELFNRSITYLMNVALIWKDVASEPVED